jgi:hypothetical protein
VQNCNALERDIQPLPEEQAQPEQMPLTIIVAVGEDGDIEVSSAQNNIDVVVAISLLELAKQKMVSIFYQGVAQTKTRNATMKKDISVPPVELLLPR